MHLCPRRLPWPAIETREERVSGLKLCPRRPFLAALAPPSFAAGWPNRYATSRDLDPLSKSLEARILPWNVCAHWQTQLWGLWYPIHQVEEAGQAKISRLHRGLVCRSMTEERIDRFQFRGVGGGPFSPTSTLGRFFRAAASIWVRLMCNLSSESVRLLIKCGFYTRLYGSVFEIDRERRRSQRSVW